MDQNLNIRVKTIKLLEHRGEDLHDVGTGNDYLYMTKVQVTKIKSR